jgi:hypothetical protein
MTFWLVVLASLIGVPALLLFTGMGVIFYAGGLAGGPQASRADKILHGWMVFACVLVAVFGAFGVAPTWRAWQGGDENFVGGLQTFIDWLIGCGIVAGLALATQVATAQAKHDPERRSPLLTALRWLLLSLGLAPWAALVAWVAWPLALWPVHGHFEWPDSSTGWTHTAEVIAVLFAAMLIEEAVRKRLKR